LRKHKKALQREARLSADNPDKETLRWISTEILPHEGEVRRWLCRVAPAGMDPSDIVQESYSRIARLQDGAVVRSGRAYFFMVARNIVREHFRRERVVRFEPLAEMDLLGIIDDEPSAERALAARQEFRLVWRLLDQLPERCRRIFVLRKIEGLSQRQIAEQVGVTENVVEKQIALGLKLLLRLLSEEAAASPAARSVEPATSDERKVERREP